MGAIPPRPTPGSLAGSAGVPALAPDGAVYIGSRVDATRNDYVQAFNANGTLRWRVGPYHAESGSPLVIAGADGIAYAAIAATIYAFDPADGHLLWSYPTHNVITSFPMIGGNASPAGGGVAVLYVGSNDWELYAIAGARAPLGGNTPPVASAGPDQSALVGEPVTFDATGSFDIDQDALSYAWSFGDGTFATGKIVTHKYQAAGNFVATVTVDDGKARSQDSAAVQIFDPIALGPSFQDDFEREDSSSLGREWGEVSGDLVIRSGEMRNASLKGNHIAIAEAVTPAACQTTSARFASVDNGSGPRFGIVLRFQDPANFYVGYRAAGGASQLRLSKVLNGVETVLGATAIANPVVNSLFGLEATASGNTLTLSLTGIAAKLTVTDRTFGGGQVGILLNPGSGTSAHRVDAFSSGPCPHP